MKVKTVTMLVPEPVLKAADRLGPLIAHDRPDYAAVGRLTRSAVLRLSLLHGVVSLQRAYLDDAVEEQVDRDGVHDAVASDRSGNRPPLGAAPRFHRTSVVLQDYLVDAAEALIECVEADPVWSGPTHFNRSNVLNLALAIGLEHLEEQHDPCWTKQRPMTGIDLFPVWGRIPGDRSAEGAT